MPKEWTMTIICPIHKKGHKTDCQNYREISLLSVIYKVFANILAKRLSAYSKRLLETISVVSEETGQLWTRFLH